MQPHGQSDTGVDVGRDDTALRRAEPGRSVVRSLAARVLTVALLATLAALAALHAPPLQAQSLTTLVSNTHLTVGSGGSTHFQAQSFETGATTGGYTVSKVDIFFVDISGKSTSVSIRKNNADNEPGDLVATLINPDTFTNDSLNTFTASPSITLDASTTYWITVNEGIIFATDRASVGRVSGNAQTGETGWSIGDDRLWRSNEASTWNSTTASLLIEFRGTSGSCDGIWCATLTVQDIGSNNLGCANGSSGNECSNTAHLTDDDFTHAMTPYTFTGVRLQSGGELQLWIGPNVTTASDSLVLHVGSETFAFDDADKSDARVRKWNNSGLSWTTGDEIQLKLTDSAPTDAKLSDLALEDGEGNAIPLNTMFASNGYDYEATVAHKVDAVKLTATKRQVSASVLITNDDDPGTPGEGLLDLIVGSNELTVTVTAPDGVTELTYTVIVKRDAFPTLVRNTHLTPQSNDSDQFQAQSFVTGANPDGYTVSEVDIRFGTVSGRDTSVKIRENNTTDEPGALVATLTNPASLTADSLNTFTARAGTTLAASTTYWISVGEGIASSKAKLGRSAADDETGEPGWSIGNGRIARVLESDGWASSNTSLLIAVKGTLGTLSTDATLSSLSLSNVTLDSTFLSGTLSYTASVANSVTSTTVTAETTDSSATSVIKLDGAVDTDGTVDLEVGDNNITVEVTAEDTVATRTYQVTVTRAASSFTKVPLNWSLTPPGLAVGDQFRLVFYSSTKRNATSTDIEDYNTFIKNLAAAGHADLDDYIEGFRAVGCTAAVDARDNTGTNTNTDGAGVPIYWLNGSKVADDNADFYDGSWDDEANDKNESGNNGPNSSQQGNYPWTGCYHSGTEAFSDGGSISNALGASDVRIGVLNDSTTNYGPLNRVAVAPKSQSRLMYGLSQVFEVAPGPPPEVTVPNDWDLIPSGFDTGDKFRLLFLSSEKTDATSTDIEDYNTFIKNRAAAGHADIQDYGKGFRAVGCTAVVDARDNTGTNTATDGAGVPIYWVNGNKVADDYADFYDGSWDDEANDKNESGAVGPDTSVEANRPFTGCDHDGTELRISGTSNALGATDVRIGRPNHSGANIGPLRGGSAVSNTATRPMYGLSQVFEVCDGIWCATLTVRDLGSSNRGCGNGSSGNECTVYLSDDDFTHAMTDYSVTAARVESDGQLRLWLNNDIATDSESLVLHVGSETFAFVDADVKQDNNRRWNNSGLTWTTGDTIELKLTEGGTLSNDATLSSLSLSNVTLDSPFLSGTLSYTASVASSVTSTTVTAETTDSSATSVIKLGGVTDTDGTVALAEGDNTITVEVTAEDTVATRTYQVTVTRAAALSNDATLSSLSLSNVTLDSPFLSGTLSYTASVASSVTSTTVTAETTDSSATSVIKLGGVTDTDGTVALAEGDNTITVEVTAEDTVATRTYQVTVTRAAALSNDATLSSLSLSNVTLDSPFLSGTLSYTASVASSVTSTTVTAETTDSSATSVIKLGGVTDTDGTVALAEGDNTITVEVTAEDTVATRTYQVTVTRAAALSNDATLSSLSLSNVTLDSPFLSGTLSYTASVASSVTSTTVTAETTDSSATSVIKLGGVTDTDGTVALAEGDNTITVEVTAEDTVATRTYQVTVTRAAALSNDATLSSLSLSNVTLDSPFLSGTLSYTASVASSVTSTTVTAETTDSSATSVIKLGGVTDTDGTVALAEGDNTITVEVTAEDTVATRTYQVTVTRAAALSNDATLSSLSLSNVTLDSPFLSGTLSYTASVASSVTSTTVTAETTDSSATSVIKLGGVTDTDGTVALAEGDNTITVEVTAEDTVATRTYQVTVTRAAALSNDATLSSLSLSNVTLDSPFLSGTLSYTASVANSVTSTTVTAETTDSSATSVIKLGGVTDTDGTVALAEGDNTITVEVTAEDTVATRTYQVTVTRAAALSNDATLSSLSLSNVTLDSPFLSGTLSYTASVASSVTSTTVTAETTDSSATSVIKLGGVTDTDGTVALAEGRQHNHGGGDGGGREHHADLHGDGDAGHGHGQPGVEPFEHERGRGGQRHLHGEAGYAAQRAGNRHGDLRRHRCGFGIPRKPDLHDVQLEQYADGDGQRGGRLGHRQREPHGDGERVGRRLRRQDGHGQGHRDGQRHGADRARGAPEPQCDGQRSDADRPRLERPLQQRQLRHNRLQDRGLHRRRLQLVRPRFGHRQLQPHLLPYRPLRRHHPSLPRLRHQLSRHRRSLKRRQCHHRPDGGDLRSILVHGDGRRLQCDGGGASEPGACDVGDDSADDDAPGRRDGGGLLGDPR